jgi:hypothetical protein
MAWTASDIHAGVDQNGPLRVPATVDTGERSFRMHGFHHFAQLGDNVVARHTHVGGGAKRRQNRLIDETDHGLRELPEFADLPPAFHRQRLNDHVVELVVVVNRSLILVHNSQAEANGTCRLHFHIGPRSARLLECGFHA